MNWLITTIIFAYASTGVIGIIAYIPTVKDLKNKIASANSSSYGLWSLTYGISFLYAIFVVSDLLLSIITGIHFVACGLIALFASKLKREQTIKK